MELRKIWEIIWRRKWIIIQAFLVISLTAVIGSYLVTPIYETSSRVLIETSDAASSLLSSIGLTDFSRPITKGETEAGTNIALATIDPVLNTVISKLQLRDRGGNLIKAGALHGSSTILSTILPKPHVEVSQFEDTYLFEIKASSSDPKEAAMIANILAEVYIEENLKRRRTDYRCGLTFIQDEIKVARTDYLKASEEIKRFKIRDKTVSLEHETRVAIDKMAELMQEKEDNIIDIYETRAKIETLRAQLGKQNEKVVSSSAITGNPQIEHLKKSLTDLELQLAAALTEKTQDHPDALALKEKINKVGEELRREVDIFQESSKDLQILERELAALEAHLKGVIADINKHLSPLYALPEKAFTQSQLELKLSASQELYGSLLDSLYQVGVAEAMAFSGIRLVETATEPDRPHRPNKTLNAIMGVFLGTMFGFGLAFLVDYLDDTIKSPEEAKEQELTLLGTIPKFRKKESPIISERNPKDLMCESYRTVRNSIKFVSFDKPINSLLVTSCLDGEGKTTTTINLAISITREEKQVLVVDMDLHRPAIHEIFGVSNLIGITNVLAEEANIEDAVKKTDVEGLNLLTSGPVPPDPGRMLESAKMRQLIRDLTEQYDIIVLDSPPVLIVNDAVVVAGYVDSLILVLESGKTSRRALSQTRELLSQANIQPSGAILNKWKIERGGYYYYKSGYYKGRMA